MQEAENAIISRKLLDKAYDFYENVMYFEFYVVRV